VEAAPDDVDARLELARSLALDDKRAEAIGQYRMLLDMEARAEAVFELALLYLWKNEGAAGRKLVELGVERYGLEEAERLGVDERLRQLSAQQAVPVAVELLERYWSH
jgi:hypothetical protein